jgi:hypothetical protein
MCRPGTSRVPGRIPRFKPDFGCQDGADLLSSALTSDETTLGHVAEW